MAPLQGAHNLVVMNDSKIQNSYFCKDLFFLLIVRGGGYEYMEDIQRVVTEDTNLNCALKRSRSSPGNEEREETIYSKG